MAKLVIPTQVRLYCDYAYESSLIAETFRSAISGGLVFLLGVLLLLIFTRQSHTGRPDASILFIAVSVFLTMTASMHEVSYVLRYFPIPPISVSLTCRLLSVGMLLVFLCLRAGRNRLFCFILTGLYLLGAALYILIQFLLRLRGIPDTFFFEKLTHSIYNLSSAAALLSVLVMGWLRWRSENSFYRLFTPAATALIPLWFLICLALPSRGEFLEGLRNALSSLTLSFFIQPLSLLLTILSLVIVIFQAVRNDLNLHAERHLNLVLGEMAQQRYENLRRHNEEVMILRHDMNRHFALLRQMTADEKAARYLDELIGQNEKIRPVIQSGHETLDLILSSRLSAAADSGVRAEIVRSNAPASLPLFDADLTSLFMNLMDNALAAASSSGAEQPYIRLDLHLKNDFFIFTCENSADMETDREPKEKETVPKLVWVLKSSAISATGTVI